MIKLPAYFSGFSSRADGSAGLRFTTQEIDAETFSELKNHHNAFGWLVFKENTFEEGDIPDENAEEEGISASERLRRRMFVFFKQKKLEGDFELWRKNQLEVLGERYLEKLN